MCMSHGRLTYTLIDFIEVLDAIFALQLLSHIWIIDFLKLGQIHLGEEGVAIKVRFNDSQINSVG